MSSQLAEASSRNAPLLQHRVALIALLCVAAIARLGLADHSLWFDEQASAFYSDHPIALLWSDWMLRETNPPLYYSLLRGWRALFGSTDFAIRSLSVLASLLAVLAIYYLVNRIYGRSAALTSALLSVLSAQHLFFAEQARSYIFEMCALTIAIDALARFTTKRRDSRDLLRGWLVYVAAATASIYLHTTAALFVAAASLAVIAADWRRYKALISKLAPLLTANIAILVGAAWEIRQAALKVLHKGDNIAAIGLVGPVQVARQTVKTLFLAGSSNLLAGLAAALIIPAVMIFVARDRGRYETRLLIALGLISLALFAVIGMMVPVFVPRTIFWISVVPTILMAAAIASIKRNMVRWIVLAALSTILFVDTWRSSKTLEQEDWNTPVDVIARYPNAKLLVQGEAMALLADNVCKRRLEVPDCPYGVIAIRDPEDRFDTWANGLFSGSIVPVAAYPNVAGRASIFMFRKQYWHDLPRLLHNHGFGADVPLNGPPFLGPIKAVDAALTMS